MQHNTVGNPQMFIVSNRPSHGASITYGVRFFQSLALFGMVSLWGCTIANPDAERSISDANTSQTSQRLSLSSDLAAPSVNNPQAIFSLEDRMLLTSDLPKPPTPAPAPSLGPLYSFRAQDLPVIDALALFARSNHLNIVAGPEITGTITVDFHHLPLEQAMSAILEAHGYYWEHNQNLIQVRQFKTKTLNVDYIRLVRSGTGQNRAQLSSGSSGGSGGGASQDTGQITVNQEDEIKFWEELEMQIKTLMSEEGRLVVNRLSGTIQITDRYKRVDEIDDFLKSVHQALYRQVEIEVRIYEVALDDQYSLGIDWSRINFDGTNGAIAIANIVTAPFGGFIAKAATTTISFEDGSFDGVLEALEEQGDVRVVSQPRVVTMNNQPALVKVATDQPFFSSTVAQGTAGNGNIVTEQVRSVTVGLVLSVTPQISEDGWIMLDVTPILSRLRGIEKSPGALKGGEGGSTAPVLDVKQSSGLVRLKDGEMVIIGGLIQEESSETERKIPLLGDIPYLGRLFKGTYTAKR
ncbi:MAG TPA: secretin N-terminal domain-containing protein, partial [Nitrospirales bacterium]|nr:secretin N-terminal domain-containing protein [Nitrospirales bacterium]